jgi:hypothetical protein
MLTLPTVPGLTRDPAFLIGGTEVAGPRFRPGAGKGT